MNKVKVGIIFGGNSSEYEISLHSVCSVLKYIDQDKYDVIKVGITANGDWYLYEGDIESIDNNTWFKKEVSKCIFSPSVSDSGLYVIKNNKLEKLTLDIVFPVLHGKNGEDGTIQGLFELAQIPYVGCNVLSSSACMDKEYSHIICENAGIKMAKYKAYFNNQLTKSETEYKQIINELGNVVFIKPANAGSSFGVSKVTNYEEYVVAVDYAFKHDKKILIEECILGNEIGVAVLGDEELIVGMPDEIVTGKSFFDFEGKYKMDNTVINCPAHISENKIKEVQELAKKVFKAMNCSGICRIDFFLSDDVFYLNELNTIPGFTNASRYPTMIKKVGYDFTQLITYLIDHKLA